MTLTEAGEISRYWEPNPPSHLLLQVIARLLGWQAARQQPQSPATSLATLAAMPPPGLAVSPAAAIAMPLPILDPTILRARNTARQIASTGEGQA